MVLVQIDLPKELDKKVRQYMLDNDIIDKRIAIIEVLRNNLK